jgi:hypothetical protein
VTKTAQNKIEELMLAHGFSEGERKKKLTQSRYADRQRFIEFSVRRVLGGASLEKELYGAQEAAIDALNFATTFAELDAIVDDVVVRLETAETVNLSFVQSALGLKAGSVPGRWYKLLKMKRPFKRRQRYVYSLVWSLCLNDPTLRGSDNASRERLMGYVLRRLRKVERMRYYVSGTNWDSYRKWLRRNNSEGHWFDHHVMRLFEYPRLPNDPKFRNILGSPSADTSADAPKWALIGGKWESKPRPSPKVAEFWDVSGNNSRDLVLNDRGRANPVKAILSFFEGADDEDFLQFPSNKEKGLRQFSSRTWNYCDRVIQILHLEEWLYEIFRLAGGSIDDWKNSDSLTNTKIKALLEDPAKGPNYVRVSLARTAGDANYVGSGSGGGTGFERKEIRIDELQIGDHLVLWNHPAYTAVSASPWRLENSLVVDFEFSKAPDGPPQLPEGIIVQGHGTSPISFGRMQTEMIDAFNDSVRSAQWETRWEITADPEKKFIGTSSGALVVQRPELEHEGLAGYWAWWIATDRKIQTNPDNPFSPPTIDGVNIRMPPNSGSRYRTAADHTATKLPVIHELVYLSDDRVAATGLNLFDDRVLGAYLVSGDFHEPSPHLGTEYGFELKLVPNSFKPDGSMIEFDLSPNFESDWVVMLRTAMGIDSGATIDERAEMVSQIETRASMPLAAPRARATQQPYKPVNYYIAYYRLFETVDGRAVETPGADGKTVLQFLRYSSPWQTLQVVRPSEVT